jgi:hypothetical protein
MKKIIFIILVCFTFISAHAQFTNTKWKVALYIPDSTDVIFDFGADTVEAFSIQDNESLETMIYTVQDTILTLKKITGQSDCDDTVIGKYKFAMKDDGMYVTMIEDSCTDRSDALNNTQKWTKVE